MRNVGERTPLGFVVGPGLVWMVVATIVATSVSGVPIQVRATMFVVALMAYAAVVDILPAMIVATLGLLIFQGFVVGAAGELAVHGSGDLIRLGLMVTATLGAWLAGSMARRVRMRLLATTEVNAVTGPSADAHLASHQQHRGEEQ